MFAAEVGVHDRTATLRNPRRRQRTSSTDSLVINAKRRKQTALTEETFVDPEIARRKHAIPNGAASKPGKSSDTASTNGIDARRRSSESLEASSSGHLAVRSKGSRRDKRGGPGLAGRGEDGVELTKTDTYVLTRDRSLPLVLQEIIATKPWHAKLVPELGYGVAFTNDRAIVWRYGHARALSTHDSGVYVIKLADEHAVSGPTAGQDAFENLPVGTLVHDAGAGELALLAVMPGGKVQYFESVRSATETEIARKGAPLRGAVSGVYGGEVITQITEAEPDGFLLATNSGRLIHLSVRDPQGRPQITTQYLKAPETGNHGLFGSIRNALRFGASGQDVISINTIPGRERSHRTVLVTRQKGIAQSWTIARHGPKTIEQEWDLKASVSEACRTVSSEISPELPVFLDLTLTPTKQDVNGEIKAMALASFSGKLFLVGLILGEGEVTIDLVHQVRSYDGSSSKTKARLLVPQPGHSAFIIFDARILVVSLTRLDDTPDAQLHFEAHEVAENYEECLFFSQKQPLHVVGSAVDLADERSEKAACDIVVHGFGHIRLAANAATADEKRSERRMKAIKSHLEQVVFFGGMSDNLLDFRSKEIWKDVKSEEIEQAAFAIMNQILDSTSPFVPSLSPSMDMQLKNRLLAVEALNRFVRTWTLPMSARWTLLWSAEKLSAARALSEIYNARLEKRNPAHKMLLEEICDMVPDTQLDAGKGDPDAVRHYLTRSVANIGEIVWWSERAIDELFDEGLTTVEEQAPLVDQADDIIIGILGTALRYREENSESFGLGKDAVLELIYQGSYAEMSELPWTCSEHILTRVGMMTELLCQMTLKLDQQSEPLEQLKLDPDIVSKLADDAPELIDAFFRAFEESCRWYAGRPNKDDAMIEQANMQRERYDKGRNAALFALGEIGLQLAATVLAEKYHDMEALALITNRVHQQGHEMLQDVSPGERDSGRTMIEEADKKEDGYFDLYGSRWADAFYPTQISQNDTARMLIRFPHRQRHLTQYLRKVKKQDPRMAKLSWINEVRGEKRFDTAAEDLMQAQSAEQRLWAKQVQLSLAKLSMLAAVETKQSESEVAAKDVKKMDQRLDIAKKQEDFYDYIRPALVGAIDDAAEVHLAMQAFGQYVAGKPTLTSILEEAFEKLVSRQVLDIEPLIDALSLFFASDAQFADDRFYSALWLLHSAGIERMDSARARLAERCIWRRAILTDDWAALNRTEGKSDAAILSEVRATAVYKTMLRGYESALFDSHPPLQPRDLHPAGETVAELRKSSRYDSSTDAYLAVLAQDLAIEDTLLDEVVVKGRLEARWEGIIEVVKADLRGEQDAQGRLIAWKEGERQEMERLLSEKQKNEVVVIPDEPEVKVEAEPEVEVETATQNGHAVEAVTNGAENGVASTEPKTQTTPKKSKKKPAAKKSKTSKKKDEQVEKENKDAEGDVVMFA